MIAAFAAGASVWVSLNQLSVARGQLDAAIGQLKAANGQLGVMSRQLDDARAAAISGASEQAAGDARQERLITANEKLADAANTQANELHAQQRPWVTINSVTPVSGLMVNDASGANLLVAINAGVIGSRPALRVSALSAGMLIPAGKNLLEAQRRLCRGEYNVSKDAIHPEVTIFPGQTYPIISAGFINASDVRRMRRKGVTKVPEAVVGCIFYQDGSGGWHHTGFIFNVTIKDGLGPGREGAPDLSVPLVQPSDIVLRTNLVGSGDAD